MLPAHVVFNENRAVRTRHFRFGGDGAEARSPVPRPPPPALQLWVQNARQKPPEDGGVAASQRGPPRRDEAQDVGTPNRQARGAPEEGLLSPAQGQGRAAPWAGHCQAPRALTSAKHRESPGPTQPHLRGGHRVGHCPRWAVGRRSGHASLHPSCCLKVSSPPGWGVRGSPVEQHNSSYQPAGTRRSPLGHLSSGNEARQAVPEHHPPQPMTALDHQPHPHPRAWGRGVSLKEKA